ncbi:glucose 1-dehydrogenase [Photobacterium sp. ZSDE20]|uniref:Glucose 1-dehydrogenase n=1 Tax=Photobacterium pectinilyticum TaxID=2906793 RepID=A0ABT1N8M3_9GAMM|nr:glucose 1-dehydrogenase [Photobacterium sp. ZSDE20]MCQ1060194.1 glucose 1-dehydrogenase [Photobacterium sp. ZSDE20]MDD1827645.1 glucose 1-dehydrogenase [Photobacterium sp. ZSDE20]
MVLFNLNSKVALITGGNRGIGLVIAKGLAAHGAKVIINNRSLETAELAAKSLRDEGYDALPVAFDVTDKEQIEKEINHIENEVGPIDILINNAGINVRHPLLEFPESVYDNIIDVNQKGTFLMIQVVGRYMAKRNRGKIINIASMQSELGRETITPYAASKGAVKMLTRGACVELAPYNIQVNAIAPGYFKSDLTKPLVDNKEFTNWLCNRVPAGRWGNVEELQGTAVYLASKASDFVNGHIVFVDGGMLSAV